MIMEDDNSLDVETNELENMPNSDVEDLEMSDSDEAATLNEDILLSIDSNGRIVTGEVKYENDGDDCDMQYVQKKFLDHRLSDTGLRTSTEDLDVSDEEEGTHSALTMQSVNLDGVAGTSAEKNVSLSTLNYSHTILKEGNSIDIELISDDEASNCGKETLIRNKCKALPPGLTVEELSSEKSCVSPNQKALNTLKVKNAFASALLLDENVQDLNNEEELVPMTCMEFLKSEYSDGNNTDAEDISLGSLDGIGETAVKERHCFQNGCETSNNLLLGNDKILSCPGDSRRSSTAEFNTEDEIFSLEKFSNRCHKRVKKRNFILVDKNEVSDDGGTDEEVI